MCPENIIECYVGNWPALFDGLFSVLVLAFIIGASVGIVSRLKK